MTTTPNLDALAQREDVRNAYRFGYHQARADVERVEAERPPFRFPNCPAWCTDHNLAVDHEVGWMYSAHRHVVEGHGWVVELEEDVEEGGVKFFPRAYDDGLTLEQTRAYLAAVQSACDAVEGRTTAS